MVLTLADISATFQSFISTTFATTIFYVFIIFVGMYIAQKVVDNLTNRYFEQAYKHQLKKNRVKISKKRFDTLAKAFRSLASVAIWIVGILLVATQTPLRHNFAALFASASVVGIAIGIAFKDVIMDLYVGFMALIEDQYRVGDVIAINQDHSGTVEDVTLRVVKLRDVDGNMHVVPHSMARAIINKTYGYSVVNIELVASYDSDIEKVKKVINDTGETMAQDEAWKAAITKPIQYQTMLKFDEAQLTFRAQGRVKPGMQWAVASEYRTRVKAAIDKSSSKLPIPQKIIKAINADADTVKKK